MILNWSRSMNSSAPSPCPGRLQQRLRARFELAAVVQPGQRIVAGLVAEPLGQLPLFGNVAGHQQPHRRAVQLDGAQPQAGPEAAAVGARQLRIHRQQHVGIGRRQPHHHLLAQQVGQAVGVHAGRQPVAGGGIAVDDGAVVLSRQQDQAGQQLIELAETLLAGLEAPRHRGTQGDRAFAGAHQRPGQRRQQPADRSADPQHQQPAAALGVFHAPGHDLPGTPAELQRHRVIRTRSAHRVAGERLRVQRPRGAIGDVLHHQVGQLPGGLGQRRGDQVGDPERRADRADDRRPPRLHRTRPGAGGEHRQAQDETVAQALAATLAQGERRRHRQLVGIARTLQRLQVAGLAVDVEAADREVAGLRREHGGDVVVAVRLAPALGVGQCLQADPRGAIGLHVLVGADVLDLGDRLRGEENRLERPDQVPALVQLQADGLGHAPGFLHEHAARFTAAAVPLRVRQPQGQRHAKHEGDHRPGPCRHPPPRRGSGDGRSNVSTLERHLHPRQWTDVRQRTARSGSFPPGCARGRTAG